MAAAVLEGGRPALRVEEQGEALPEKLEALRTGLQPIERQHRVPEAAENRVLHDFHVPSILALRA